MRYCKILNTKNLIFSCLFFTLIWFISVDSATAQRNRNPVKNATWQTSVDDSERGNVVLGIRDKWATLGSYNALFVVTAPSKKTFRARTATTDDEWAYINFPDGFNGSPLATGTYTVVFYVNGIVIGRDKFKFRP